MNTDKGTLVASFSKALQTDPRNAAYIADRQKRDVFVAELIQEVEELNKLLDQQWPFDQRLQISGGSITSGEKNRYNSDQSIRVALYDKTKKDDFNNRGIELLYLKPLPEAKEPFFSIELSRDLPGLQRTSNTLLPQTKQDLLDIIGKASVAALDASEVFDLDNKINKTYPDFHRATFPELYEPEND